MPVRYAHWCPGKHVYMCTFISIGTLIGILNGRAKNNSSNLMKSLTWCYFYETIIVEPYKGLIIGIKLLHIYIRTHSSFIIGYYVFQVSNEAVFLLICKQGKQQEFHLLLASSSFQTIQNAVLSFIPLFNLYLEKCWLRSLFTYISPPKVFFVKSVIAKAIQIFRVCYTAMYYLVTADLVIDVTAKAGFNN